MKVCIVEQSLRRDKRYQIMVRDGNYCFNHVFPGKLFTLEEAQRVCAEQGFTIIAIGNIYQIH